MRPIKTGIVFLLCAVMLIGTLPFTALIGSAEGPNARLIHADVRVYAGGLYNIDANCDDPDAVYALWLKQSYKGGIEAFQKERGQEAGGRVEKIDVTKLIPTDVRR